MQEGGAAVVDSKKSGRIDGRGGDETIGFYPTPDASPDLVGVPVPEGMDEGERGEGRREKGEGRGERGEGRGEGGDEDV